MGRHTALRAVASVHLACCCGCGIPSVGLVPTAPPVETELFARFPAFTPVDSLEPTLSWTALDIGTAEELAEVTYELRVWRTETGYSGTLVYARDRLTAPAHRLEAPLAPGTRYLWTVRARFSDGGEAQVTEWGLAGHLLREQVVPNASCFRFETPPSAPSANRTDRGGDPLGGR